MLYATVSEYERHEAVSGLAVRSQRGNCLPSSLNNESAYDHLVSSAAMCVYGRG